jgi:hypothetical protein
MPDSVQTVVVILALSGACLPLALCVPPRPTVAMWPRARKGEETLPAQAITPRVIWHSTTSFGPRATLYTKKHHLTAINTELDVLRIAGKTKSPIAPRK